MSEDLKIAATVIGAMIKPLGKLICAACAVFIIVIGYAVVISAIKANEESALLRQQLATERKAKPAEKCSELKTAGLKFCVADNSGR